MKKQFHIKYIQKKNLIPYLPVMAFSKILFYFVFIFNVPVPNAALVQYINDKILNCFIVLKRSLCSSCHF